MSQAIQRNAQVAMTRHPHFLRTAEALRPALHSQSRQPMAVIQAHADPEALFGWRGDEVGTLADFSRRELTSGDSAIIDFGSHIVGYLHFTCLSAGSPPRRPGPFAIDLRRNPVRSVRTLQRLSGLAQQQLVAAAGPVA